MDESLPETQSGFRVQRWGEEPVWEEFQLRAPGEGEATIRVDACGVGRTVLNCINGDLSSEPALCPVVPGHEIAGTVRAAGAGVPPDLVGRRVVAYFYLSCGRCPECVRGDDSRCRHLAGWIGVHRDGGYARYSVLPASNLVVIPESVESLSATVIPDAVATPVHVVKRAAIEPEDRVVVLGAGGGVGIHMIQVAALRGADVVGLDVTRAKLAAIEELGTRSVDSSDLPGIGTLFVEGVPTVVIDLLGVAAMTRWAIDVLGPGGRLVALTTFRNRSVSFEPRELVFRELSLLGSRYATKSEVAEAARLVASGHVKPVIGEVTRPDGVPELHARLRSNQLVGRGAIDWSDER